MNHTTAAKASTTLSAVLVAAAVYMPALALKTFDPAPAPATTIQGPCFTPGLWDTPAAGPAPVCRYPG